MAVSNSLVKAQQKTSLTAYLTKDAVKEQINKVVGGKNGERFITSIVSAVQANPALQECTNSSILSSALVGEALKLSPSPQMGEYYLIPFKNTKAGVTEAQIQIGYKGILQLCVRSGQFAKIVASEVKEGELVSYNPITEEVVFNPCLDTVQREKLKTVGYYAEFQLVNGFRKCEYWSRERMEAHAMRYSQGYRSDVKNHTAYTFWSKDFDGMAKKTILKHLCNGGTAPKSIEMRMAFESDGAVIRENDTVDYVDNVPDEPITVEAETVTVDAETVLLN